MMDRGCGIEWGYGMEWGNGMERSYGMEWGYGMERSYEMKRSYGMEWVCRLTAPFEIGTTQQRRQRYHVFMFSLATRRSICHKAFFFTQAGRPMFMIGFTVHKLSFGDAGGRR